MWTDEANFYLCGQVNTHNCRIWDVNNPHAFLEAPLHAEKVTVWCGFTSDFIIGPYFYQKFNDQDDIVSVTVNGARYREMLEDYVMPELAARNALNVIWMQDGAPPHVTNDVMDFLEERFGNQIISRRSEHAWPPRSPDLTPCDFFLWGYLKSIVYKNGPPASMPDLLLAITRAVESLTPAMLRKSVHHTVTRMQAVLDNGGGHFEHLLC
jgi:hypothetical protein